MNLVLYRVVLLVKIGKIRFLASITANYNIFSITNTACESIILVFCIIHTRFVLNSYLTASPIGTK